MDNQSRDVRQDVAEQYWRKALGLFLFLLPVYLYSCQDALWSLVQLWYYAGSYRHGYFLLCLACAGFLQVLFLARDKTPSPSFYSLFGVIFSIGLAFLSYTVQMYTLHSASCFLLLWFVIYACFGSQVSKGMAIPIGFLFLTLPWVIYWIPNMQNGICFFLKKGFDFFGILEFQSGIEFVTNHGSFFINESFLGIRYLGVGLAIAILYAYLLSFHLIQSFVFVILSACLCLVFNWIRIFVTILYGYLHYRPLISMPIESILFFGWVFYFSLIFSILLTGFLILKTNLFGQNRLKFKKKRKRQLSFFEGTSRHVMMGVLVSLCLLAQPFLMSQYLEWSHRIPIRQNVIPIEAQAGWHQVPLSHEQMRFRPVFLELDAEIFERYVRPEVGFVDLFMGYFNHQYVGNELVAYPGYLNHSGSWMIGDSKVYTVHPRLPDHPGIRVHALLLRGKHENRLVWYWFWVNGQNTVYPLYAKWLEIWDVLDTLQTHSAVFVLSTAYTGRDPQVAERVLQQFVEDNEHALRPTAIRAADIEA
jgi:EpsI family protein